MLNDSDGYAGAIKVYDKGNNPAKFKKGYEKNKKKC